MAKPLSKKVDSISSSIAFAVMELARERKAQNKEVFSLSAGEPDFSTPEPILKKAAEGAGLGYTRYTPVPGLLEVRKSVCAKLEKENGLFYTPDEITLHSGTKHALFVTLQALLDEGDEVIIPAPYWVSYSEMVKIAGGKCVIIQTEEKDDFLLSAKLLKEAITPKTKALMINNPLNPTGAVFSREQLYEIGEICAKEGIYILCDEIYERIVYDVPFTSMATLSEEIKNVTVTLGGLSKSHAMTGWRFGYSAANKEVALAISKIQSHTISHPSSLTQYAALAAYDGSCDQYVEDMVSTYRQRREKMNEILGQIPNIHYTFPEGAFYFFVNVQNYFNETLNSSQKFAAELASKTGVLAIPGSAFGMDGYLRFSYATDLDTIIKGMHAFKVFLEAL